MVDFSLYTQHWLSFLRGADALLGLPLLGAGVALMLMGWRLWPVVSCLSMALVGGVLGQTLCGDAQLNLLWAGSGVLVLGAASLAYPQYASTAVGGVLGGALVAGSLQGMGLDGPVQWAAGAVAFAGAVAWAYAYRHQVVVFVTSIEGGALLASGLAVLIPEVPMVAGFFRSMTATSPFMVGFFVLVPTVVGVLMQQADSNRSSSKAVRG